MDVYKIVTDRIIEELEKGHIPWRRPWMNCTEGAFNRISKRPYSLLNQMLLSRSGEWASFKQWTELGGKIRKGEKGELVIFWKLQEVKDEKDEEKKVIPILKYYHVFHVSQVENVDQLEAPETFHTEPIREAEKVLHNYIDREKIKLSVIEGGSKAYYSPREDKIVLPAINQFEKSEMYYSTAFHEASHSTMKKNRCDREADNKKSAFGNAGYSKEELVAEIASASLLHTLNIETPESFKNSVAYIENWLQVLKNDKKFIISASSKAEKAAKYILNKEVS